MSMPGGCKSENHFCATVTLKQLLYLVDLNLRIVHVTLSL